jgi:RNA polymerase sigma factor (sigma-70 family)
MQQGVEGLPAKSCDPSFVRTSYRRGAFAKTGPNEPPGQLSRGPGAFFSSLYLDSSVAQTPALFCLSAHFHSWKGEVSSMPKSVQTNATLNESQCFSTTHWSVVVLAGQKQSVESADALELLCRRYWPPVYAFIRRRGYQASDAQDLTQEFFTRWLRKDCVQSADATKGKFRTFVLTAVTRLLANEHERAKALKRGARCVHYSLDDPDAEGPGQLETSIGATPETIFERTWAEAVLREVLGQLRQEYENCGEQERFEALKPFLIAEKQKQAGATAAAQLGVTESAVYSAVHRLRKRYGEILREEVDPTVGSPGEIEEELRYLVRVLSR